MNNEMPELKAGDVICTSGGFWYLCISPTHFYALCRDGERREVVLIYHTTVSLQLFEITRVYRRTSYFDVSGDGSLYRLLSDPESKESSSALIWSSKPAVREMTVDQISKELGYIVKVIGNE